MDFKQLVKFFDELNMPQTAKYFAHPVHCDNNLVVDGLIEYDFVKSHCTLGDEHFHLWRQVESNVVTYIGCDF
jgi:hypothetical protein